MTNEAEIHFTTEANAFFTIYTSNILFTFNFQRQQEQFY